MREEATTPERRLWDALSLYAVANHLAVDVSADLVIPLDGGRAARVDLLYLRQEAEMEVPAPR